MLASSLPWREKVVAKKPTSSSRSSTPRANKATTQNKNVTIVTNVTPKNVTYSYNCRRLSYRIIYYIKYIIYNLKQRYLFDFQRDKNFNLGKIFLFMMLPVTYVTFVTKNVTFVTFVTPKNVTLFLNFYLRALKKILTPWKNNLTPRKKNLRASSCHFQGS